MIIRHNGSEREFILIKKIALFLTLFCIVPNVRAVEPINTEFGGGIIDNTNNYCKDSQYSCVEAIDGCCDCPISTSSADNSITYTAKPHSQQWTSKTDCLELKKEVIKYVGPNLSVAYKVTELKWGGDTTGWQTVGNPWYEAAEGYYYIYGNFAGCVKSECGGRAALCIESSCWDSMIKSCGRGHCCVYDTSMGESKECANGTYAAVGTMKCNGKSGNYGLCKTPDSGYYANDDKKGQTQCPAGTCCLNGEKHVCIDGTYSDTAGLVCDANTEGKCKTPDSGHFANDDKMGQTQCPAETCCLGGIKYDCSNGTSESEAGQECKGSGGACSGSVQTECQCSNLQPAQVNCSGKSKDDCENLADCKWDESKQTTNTDGTTTSCINRTSECSGYTDKRECNSNIYCSWQDGKDGEDDKCGPKNVQFVCDDVKGGTNCKWCPAGYWCKDHIKTKCESGKYSMGGVDKCIDRVDFSFNMENNALYCPDGGTCELCPVGACCLDGIIHACKYGTFSVKTGLKCSEERLDTDKSGTCLSFSYVDGTTWQWPAGMTLGRVYY